MNTYKVFCEFESSKVKDTFEVFGNYYDVSDGYLDVYISEELITATFCPGHWRAIILLPNPDED